MSLKSRGINITGNNLLHILSKIDVTLYLKYILSLKSFYQ